MADLFGSNLRCIFLLDLAALGQLINLPSGAKAVGAEYDESLQLLKIGIEGAGCGRPAPETPPEMSGTISHFQAHVVGWPLADTANVPDTHMNLGPRLSQPPLGPPAPLEVPVANAVPVAASKIVPMPRPESAPCEPSE